MQAFNIHFFLSSSDNMHPVFETASALATMSQKNSTGTIAFDLKDLVLCFSSATYYAVKVG